MKEVFTNFIKLLYQPKTVFSNLKDKPNLLIAIVLLLLITLLHLLISVPIEAKRALVEISSGVGKLSQAELMKAKEMMASPIMIIISLIGGLIGTLFSWFLQGGVFYLFCTLLGGQGSFRESLAVVVYAWLPISIRKILQGSAMLISGQAIGGGLASLLPKSQELTATGILLRSLDIFVVWNLILLVMGLVIVHHISTRQSGAIVISYWIISIMLAMAGVLVSTSLRA